MSAPKTLLPAESPRIAATREIIDVIFARYLLMLDSDTEATIDVMLEAERELDAMLCAEQQAVLANSLWGSDEDQQFCEWSAHQFGRIAEICGKLVERLLESPGAHGQDPRLRKLIEVALVNAGHAVKWEYISGKRIQRRDWVNVHRLFRHASEYGFAHESRDIVRADATRTMTPESIYIRVLLLDALRTGNLTRQQIEILDCWLWSWVESYHLGPSPGADNVGFCVDPASDAGLRPTFIAAQGHQTAYLGIEPLHAQIEAVVRDFHAGQIYPGSGPALDFRVEEHIAVIDFLKRFLTASRQGANARRAPRKSGDSRTVEGFLGLEEIIPRALRKTDAAHFPASPPPPGLDLKGLGSAAGLARERHIGHAQQLEKTKRLFQVHDVSEGGLGLEVEQRDADDIAVGDLIGVAEPGTVAPTIGEVVRKAPQPNGTGVLLGVRIITDLPALVALHQQGNKSHAGENIEAVFVTGEENCGRFDTMLLRDGMFSTKNNYELAFPEETYVLRFNRVRRHGRGWVCAGFEVVEVNKSAKPAAAVDQSLARLLLTA